MIRRLVLLAAACLLVIAAPNAGAAPGPEPRIVGGGEADPGEYPFQVALLYANESDVYFAQFCAGALIDPEWVLTAAHCVTGNTSNDPSEVDVLANTHLLDGSGDRIDVLAIIKHPGYDPDTEENDAALLRLAVPANTGLATNAVVTPATTAQAAAFAPGEVATVIGWGNTESIPRYPEALHEVEVPIVSDLDCGDAYPGEFIAPGMICAGDLVDGGVDSCQGDSGGPLIVPDGSGGWLHVGVVSWGYGCAEPGDPGVYTRTAIYAGWIAAVAFCDGDPPTWAWDMAPMFGTPAADTVTGTEGADFVVTGLGNDDIETLGGDDLVCGGPGADTIDTGDGLDRIWGGPGRDVIFGGRHRDRIWGQLGADTIAAEGGNDIVRGGAGDDEIFGGGSDDRLFGNGGDDTIAGGPGFDLIRGGIGTDTCTTGEDVIC